MTKGLILEHLKKNKKLHLSEEMKFGKINLR